MTVLIPVIAMAALSVVAWQCAPAVAKRSAEACASAGVTLADYVRAARWRVVVNVPVVTIFAIVGLRAASDLSLGASMVVFAVAVGFALPVTYALHWLLNRSLLMGYNDTYLRVRRARASGSLADE